MQLQNATVAIADTLQAEVVVTDADAVGNAIVEKDAVAIIDADAITGDVSVVEQLLLQL